jgi:hypothetical protein
MNCHPNTMWKNFIFRFTKRINDYTSRSMYHNLDETLLNTVPNFGPTNTKIKILNYFQLKHSHSKSSQQGSYNSITTELYCNALGMDRTPNICNCSRDRGSGKNDKNKNDSNNNNNNNNSSSSNDNNNNNTNVVANTNVGSLDSVAYLGIIISAHERGWINISTADKNATKKSAMECGDSRQTPIYDEKLNKCVENTKYKCGEYGYMYCDEINLCSSDYVRQCPMINSSNSNIKSWDRLERYHKVTLNKKGITNLPLICPPRTELEMLLQKSLKFE